MSNVAQQRTLPEGQGHGMAVRSNVDLTRLQKVLESYLVD